MPCILAINEGRESVLVVLVGSLALDCQTTAASTGSQAEFWQAGGKTVRFYGQIRAPVQDPLFRVVSCAPLLVRNAGEESGVYRQSGLVVDDSIEHFAITSSTERHSEGAREKQISTLFHLGR